MSRAPAASVAGASDEPTRLLALPPLSAILRLALPTTAVMLVATLSNVLQTYFISLLGDGAIAAVSLIFPISLLTTTIMVGGVGSGVASAVARALGAGHEGGARDIAEHAVALGAIAGGVVAFAAAIGAPSLFRSLGGSPTVSTLAIPYAWVLFGGSIVPFLGAMLDSTMRGEGEVRVPALWSITSLVLQMAATPVAMFVLDLGLLGAPAAMLACQGVALAARARHVFGGRCAIRPRPWPRRLRIQPLRAVLQVGVPASMSTAIHYVGIIALTAILARFGDAHLAAFGLVTRMDFILMSLAYGCGSALLTLVGLAAGAGRASLVAVYVSRAGALMVGILTPLAAYLIWHPAAWLGLFTDDPAIHAIGADYFHIVGPSYPWMGISMMAAFAFQGMNRATIPLAFMACRVATAVIAASAAVHAGYGERTVFYAVSVANIGAAIGLGVALVRCLRTRA